MQLTKLTKTLWLFLVVFMLSLTSCNTSYYAPSPHNVPLLQEQNEVLASAGRTEYNRSLSTNVQVAYSPIKGVGTMVNASFFEPQYEAGSDIAFGMKGGLIETAAGYYTKVGDVFTFDAYLGYGYLYNGSTSLDYFYSNPNGAGDVNFNYHRFFLQPSMGYTHDFVDLILSIRVSQLKYQNVYTDSILSGSAPEGYTSIFENEDFTMVEPAITIRAGYKYLKFQGQFGVCYNMSAYNFAHDTYAISFGIVLNFRPSFKGTGLLPRFE